MYVALGGSQLSVLTYGQLGVSTSLFGLPAPSKAGREDTEMLFNASSCVCVRAYVCLCHGAVSADREGDCLSE